MGRIVPKRQKEPTRLTDKEKIELLNKTAPKMFYTPDEFPCKDNIARLYFFNTEIQSLDFDDSGISMNSIRSCVINYIKLKFMNSKWDYLMVQEDQEKNFRELFLGETITESDRKYI